ncbi:hypothetical protein [Streptomyces sp. SID3343]|uniref:hypothetical protein n=1 Tax=Streptomyces sp. SID3343 TaxID=2690260 RepID=UPI001370414B|nr:hypothetical protein [Streptomyces sp. SID3343]MYW06527.1 hypothetical protein [Streptomyces sp. SID3343]
MAMRKKTMQKQIAEAVAQANPSDQPIVTMYAVTGSNPMFMAFLGVIWTLMITQYFFTVTQQAVVIHRASKLTTRPKEVVHVLAHAQAASLISDVRLKSPWSSFRILFPGERETTRLNVPRVWRAELEYALNFMAGAGAQQHH